MITKITYSRDENTENFQFSHPAFSELTINYDGIAPEERAGMPKMFLGASVLSCYASMLSALLVARGIHYNKISGNAEIVAGPNSLGQGRVLSIKITLSISLPENERESFPKMERIMRNGCLITSSLKDGINVSYTLDPDFS